MTTDRRRSETLDRSVLAQVAGADPDAVARFHREYLAAVYVMAKNSLVFPLNNPALIHACERAATVVNTIRQHSEQRAAISFRSGGVFVNNAIVKLAGGAYEQGEYLSTVFHVLGVGEIATLDTTTVDDWRQLAQLFKEAVVSGNTLGEMRLGRIHLVPADESSFGATLDVGEKLRALRAYALLHLALEEVIERLSNERRPKIRSVKRAVHQLIEAVDNAPELIMALIHLKRHKIGPSHHGANTAAIVIAASREIGLTRRQRTELAVQAALHDFGQAFVSDDADEEACAIEWIRRWVPLTSIYYYNLGRLVVANEVRLPVNGSAQYPWPPWNASRLVAVAHAYDLLTSPRPGRPALMPDDALRLLMGESGRRYDPIAVKLLTNELGVYPVGSTVALSDRRTAIVIEAPRERSGPTQPKVKIIRDASGTFIDGGIIDLAGESGLGITIVRCVDAEDLQINPPAFLLG